MARFSQTSLERVKDAANIVEIVSQYTDLRRSGARFTGLCPFHDERTPSFSVDPVAGLYYCFGCGAGGDAIKFVEEKEGLTFSEAVEALAERFGVELEREAEDPAIEEARRRRTRLGELLDRTATFYATYLWESEEARKAREYLLGRGLAEDALRAFGVGYAPSAWDTVLVRAQRAGYSVAEIAAAGLIKRGRQGSYYDHFRARITFPIRDARGRMQGFGARTLNPENPAKYVNSPEGELFHKSRILYAIDRARPAIARRGRAVVVEGYTDVIAAHQAGFEETVAVMGTAITPEQIRLLAAHTEEVILALDADRAGREAMLRAQRAASGKRVRLRVARMPEGEDPADLLAGERAGSAAAERFGAALDEAVDLPAFHVRTLLEEANLKTPVGRDRALDEVVPVLAAMPDSITRGELVREVADRLDADPALVSRRLAAAERGAGAGADPAPRSADGEGRDGDGGPARAPAALSAQERREQALLGMCIAAPDFGREYLERLRPEHLSSDLSRRAREWLLLHLDDPMGGLGRDDEELLALITRLTMIAEREPASPEAMEETFLRLELAALEREIEAHVDEVPVELHRKRKELVDRLAHGVGAHRAGGTSA
ncbi:MAG TPA: DNA primase [Solirubrobacterales bacterium]|jgi:DNA primase